MARHLSEGVYETLLRKRQVDGYGKRPWGDWLTYLSREWSRTPTDSERRREETGEGLMQMWLMNFADNLPDIREGLTLRDLLPKENPTKPAVIVGRGPSFFKHQHAKLLAEYRDKITIVSTDGSSSELLRNGCVPDYSLTVDGSEKVLPFYLTPEWTKFGSEIKVVLVVSANPQVYEKCVENGSKVYWAMSMWDDHKLPESLVRWLTMMCINRQRQDSVSTLRVGTNAGEGCFSLAYAILKFSTIALCGMDMGYPQGFPLEETAYYQNAKAASVDMLHFSTVFTQFHHPQLGNSFADPVFCQYRNGFRDMASELHGVRVVNCTGGGTLFGENIEILRLKDFLDSL